MERDALTERVEVIEVKVDGLAESVAELKHTMDRRFDVVDQRFEAVDQRFEAVDQRFDAVDQRFEAVDQRFDAVDQRFEAVDRRFDAVDQRFDAVDRRFDETARAVDDAFLEQRQYTEFVYTQLDAKMDAGFGRVDGHLSRLERKLDRVIELITPRG